MRTLSTSLFALSCFVVAACGDDTSGGGGSGGAASAAGTTTTQGTDAASTTGTNASGDATTGPGATSASSTSTSTSTGSGAGLLADAYPGDIGIENDPAVVWTESFEQASIEDVVARYDDAKAEGLSLDADVPAASSGASSGRFTASGAGPNAVDLFKSFDAGYDELFVRYYVKYQADVTWHHTGVWVGGYAPPTDYPNPQAGLKPNGDDRFSVSIEPVWPGSPPRLDTYDYWMKMRSWMDQPEGDTAYYGNPLIHREDFLAQESWQCIEIRIKVNDDLASAAGAALGVWLDDGTIAELDDQGPLGYWVRDKWCPDDTTAPECTDYRPDAPELVPVDLQVRTTADLAINNFWPQNYITEGGPGSVWYDDMVVATRRIGCIRP